MKYFKTQRENSLPTLVILDNMEKIILKEKEQLSNFLDEKISQSNLHVILLATKVKGDDRIKECFFQRKKVIELSELDPESAAKLFLSKSGSNIKIKTVNQLLENFYFKEALDSIPLIPANILKLANCSEQCSLDRLKELMMSKLDGQQEIKFSDSYLPDMTIKENKFLQILGFLKKGFIFKVDTQTLDCQEGNIQYQQFLEFLEREILHESNKRTRIHIKKRQSEHHEFTYLIENFPQLNNRAQSSQLNQTFNDKLSHLDSDMKYNLEQLMLNNSKQVIETQYFNYFKSDY